MLNYILLVWFLSGIIPWACLLYKGYKDSRDVDLSDFCYFGIFGLLGPITIMMIFDQEFGAFFDKFGAIFNKFDTIFNKLGKIFNKLGNIKIFKSKK